MHIPLGLNICINKTILVLIKASYKSMEFSGVFAMLLMRRMDIPQPTKTTRAMDKTSKGLIHTQRITARYANHIMQPKVKRGITTWCVPSWHSFLAL
jgi:hypothetical protein